jgi:hypothetical protein
VLVYEEKVKKEKPPKNNSGNKEWGQYDISLPCLSSEGLVASCGNISANESEQSIQKYHNCPQGPTVGR